MKNIEERLHNTDQALMSLVAILQDVLPPAYSDDVTVMMSRFYDANVSLGSVYTGDGFITKDDT